MPSLTTFSPRVALAAPVLALTLASCHAESGGIDALDEAPPPAPASASQLSAPVEYDFTPLLQVVERVVPETFGSLDSVRQLGRDSRKHYAFEARRGRFTAFADGDQVHLRATVTYAARAFFKPPIGPTVSAGCGGDEAGPRMVVELATPLTLSPDWHLVSRARLVRLAPASTESRDRCDVSILKLDVTRKVTDAARKAIASHLRKIDQMVAKVDVGERFARWWSVLGRPIRLSAGIWLLLDPERVDVGTVTGQGHMLVVPVSVAARPRIVTAAQPPDVDATPLPQLGRGGAADGYRVVMDGIVDYATASAAVTRALAGKVVAGGGRSLVVSRVTVAPAPRGRLTLDVDFTGDAHGRLRFVGRPVLDTRRHEITVPDLDYDLHSDDALINAYAWLRSDDLRATFRDKARVPLAPALERGKALLLAGLNRDIGRAVSLRGTVDSVAARALYITSAGLIARAEARGHAGLAVLPPGPATVAAPRGGSAARLVSRKAQ